MRAWVALSAAMVAVGCGGEEARQDADEPSGTWKLDVVDADFPTSQRLAKQETLRIRVRNADDRPAPNVAVTVNGFSRRSEQGGLSDPNRPVWILDNGPRGGTTAYTNTWALGRIEPGATKTFEWRVTPVVAGTHEVSYKVSAGLDGKAKAQLVGGAQDNEFRVRVAREPSQSRVDPDSGEVVRD